MLQRLLIVSAQVKTGNTWKYELSRNWEAVYFLYCAKEMSINLSNWPILSKNCI